MNSIDDLLRGPQETPASIHATPAADSAASGLAAELPFGPHEGMLVNSILPTSFCVLPIQINQDNLEIPSTISFAPINVTYKLENKVAVNIVGIVRHV